MLYYYARIYIACLTLGLFWFDLSEDKAVVRHSMERSDKYKEILTGTKLPDSTFKRVERALRYRAELRDGNGARGIGPVEIADSACGLCAGRVKATATSSCGWRTRSRPLPALDHSAPLKQANAAAADQLGAGGAIGALIAYAIR